MAESQSRPGSFHLFRLFGIDVSLHWSWLLIAVYQLQTRQHEYSRAYWPVLEYLALFAIVLMHEFGHALACRSVGGKADHIMLWPLGGVAYVNPPQRAAALLWSIFAGPLVNILLIPAMIGLAIVAGIPLTSPFALGIPDFVRFFNALFFINIVLLVFNLLPIYPLDGGQILRSLLWFVLGQARSLLVAAAIGLLGAAAIMGLALWIGDYWLVVLAAFGAFQSWTGFRHAQMLHKVLSIPRHHHLACPACGQAPPSGPLWRCSCGQALDAFLHPQGCPRCGQTNDANACPFCGTVSPVYAWHARGGFPVTQAAAQPYVPPTLPHGFDRQA